MTNIDIVKIICKELGKPESLITYVADRKGHDMRYAIDPTKIHNELGWLPETNSQTVSRKQSNGILITRNGGETIISGEYQNYYEKCTQTRGGIIYENFCNRCRRSALTWCYERTCETRLWRCRKRHCSLPTAESLMALQLPQCLMFRWISLTKLL